MPQRQGSDMKKSIDVYGVTVPIKTYHDEHDQLMGYCEKSPIKIFINTAHSKKDQYESLTHELIHAVFFRLGLDQVLSYEMQEVLAEGIGNFIASSFKLK